MDASSRAPGYDLFKFIVALLLFILAILLMWMSPQSPAPSPGLLPNSSATPSPEQRLTASPTTVPASPTSPPLRATTTSTPSPSPTPTNIASPTPTPLPSPTATPVIEINADSNGPNERYECLRNSYILFTIKSGDESHDSASPELPFLARYPR